MTTRFKQGLGATLALGFAALTSGCGSGANINADGGGAGGPGAESFGIDFELRRDLFFTSGFLGDSLAVDLNGDGATDIVSTEFADLATLISLGDGTGNFQIFFNFRTPGAPLSLAAGDFRGDGDGLLDIAVACKAQDVGLGPVENSIVILEQVSQGVFEFLTSFDLDAAAASAPGFNSPLDLAAGALGGAADELVVTLPNLRATWRLALENDELVQVESLTSSGLPQNGRPVTVTTIDADGDDLLDVVVGEDMVSGGGTDRVVLYHNTPDAQPGLLLLAATTLGAPEVVLPGVLLPIVQNMGDLEGDGFDDLGVAEFNGSRVFLLSGGLSGFTGALTAIDFGSPVSSVTAADFNSDGLMDVAATMLYDGAVEVRLASEEKLFDLATAYNVGFLPRAIAAVALQFGGVVDLVACNAQDVSLLEGYGDGTFRAAKGYRAEGSRPRSVEAADLTGDGAADAVAMDLFQREILFYEGAGDGSLELRGMVSLNETDRETPGTMLIRDFDDDGDQDVMVPILETGEVALLRNNGSLPLSAPTAGDRIFVGGEPMGLDAADLDGDGNLDVVVADGSGTSYHVLMGTGGGAFDVQTARALPLPPLAVLLEDFDNDALVDLAIATGAGNPALSALLVFQGNGDGTFAELPSSQLELPAQASTLLCGNFDGDEFCDIAASQVGEDADAVFVFINAGDLSFAPRTIEMDCDANRGCDPGTIQIDDLDGDGLQDILIPLGNGELRIVLGNGAGEFTEIVPLDKRFLSVPFKTADSSWADMDGDGRPELLLVSPRSPYVWVGKNLSLALELL